MPETLFTLVSFFIRSPTAFLVLFSFIVFTDIAGAARGRPVINAAKTTFVADNGSLLRGAIISTETGAIPSLAAIQTIKSYGLNAIHCYAERSDYGYPAGAKVAAVDAVVQMTRDNGLYLVITVGGGGINATFNAAFWNFYAARYANETHVLYEIQNEPASGPPVSSDVITMEKNDYAIIRAAAPGTPVLLMSYMTFQNGAGVLQDISSLGSLVNWSNAAIAFHGYGDKGPPGIRTCLQYVLNAGYPCFQTEFYRWPWGTGNFTLGSAWSLYQDVSETGDLERLGVSWLSFLSISRITDDTRFKNVLAGGGILWTPDFGSWPSGSRGTYANGGAPWAITKSTPTRIQAENFDTGGQGIAYNDSATINSGGQYRTAEGVDIQTTGDTGGGYNIGWMVAGEWLEYTTYVTDPGRYTLNIRVASPNATGSLRVKMAGADITGAWTFSGTGGNQTWSTISQTVDLIPGQQVMRLEVLTSGFNLNWIEFAPAATGVLANGTYQVFSRKTLKAMDVVNASTADNAKLQQWTYGAGSNQKWILTHRGANQYTITSAQTGKGIDEASGTALSGDYIAMWALSGGAGALHQQWLVAPTDSGFYKIVSVNSGLVLEIVGASADNGAMVDQSEYAGGTHQQWLVTSDHPATFSAWVNQQFPLSADRINAAVSGPSADPKGQGAPNLMRYAFGLGLNDSPTPALSVLTASASSLGLRFRFDPGLTDITYRVEASTDLVDWSETVFDSRLDMLPPLTDGWIEIDGAFDPQQTPRRFLRLHIIQN